MNAYQAVILSMNQDGYSDQQIADHLKIDVKEVTEIIDADRAAKTTEPNTVAGPPADEPVPAPEPPAEVAELLAWAADHDDQAVRADGETAAAVLTRLRERRAVDAELERITSEKSQLEKRLAELAAREDTLRPPKPAKKKTKQLDYDAAEVRAWARENGHEVPDRGRIPAPVLTAWRARPGARPLAAVS
ncbi:Lsr2 family DNA-binding protein [Streptomyces ipomoeae]|uniref:Lsr2 family DNA-binding protein n=1 Tax=Streptomyces ipomoeae TaxID=103232 RepID=UPI0029B4AE56|nr:histone-like nucleoid-structuring protein Lsr2 [Streptomyces ipomoeae]MDX2698929.1 Lsr2 family protein [Streptomyces ipomoeae]MDX2844571.1 Lsr2 family protein [Streptomyces ipomoeae]